LHRLTFKEVDEFWEFSLFTAFGLKDREGGT